MLYILGIVACVMAVKVTEVITDHKRKILEIKAKMVQDEIELEKLKQQNFVIETEKMKLELEQLKLGYVPGKGKLD